MKYLKKFTESQTYVDNEDIINIVQDVRDLGFHVRVNVKYTYKSEVGPHFNFNVITRDAKFSESVKCYCIDIRKNLENDIPEKLSDLFNSLEEINSRFSEIGQTIQNISINTRNGYPSEVDCVIKFIVVTGEEISKDQGSDIQLIRALNDAGFKTSKGDWETEIWVDDLFKPIKMPEGFYIGSVGNYSVDPELRNKWDETRQKRHQELTEKWQEIKKIARQVGIGVRRLGTSNEYDSLKIRITDKKSKVKLNESVSNKDPFKIEMITQIKELFYILEDEGNKVDTIQTNQFGELKSLEIKITNNKNHNIINTDYIDEFIDRCDEIAKENGFYVYNLYDNRMFSGRKGGDVSITFRKGSSKLYESSTTDEEEITHIFNDVCDIGATINIQEGWTTKAFLPNLKTYIPNNEMNDEEEEENQDDVYDTRTNSNIIFVCPRKNLTRTYKILITSKRCNSENLLNIFEELKTASDRLSDYGKVWSSYNVINNNLRATVWLKTNEFATLDIRDQFKKYLTSIGINYRELNGPPGPNEPANLFLDFDSDIKENEKEILKPKKYNSFNLPGSKQKIISKRVVDYCNELRNKLSQKLNFPLHGIRIIPHTNFEKIELSLADHIY